MNGMALFSVVVVAFMVTVCSSEKSHLVTMRKAELLRIVNCVSKSKNPMLCEKFVECEKKMPHQVVIALEKCQKEHLAGQMKRCSKHEPLYKSPEIPAKIFECMAANIHKLSPQEKKIMTEFEECAVKLGHESCKAERFHHSLLHHSHH